MRFLIPHLSILRKCYSIYISWFSTFFIYKKKTLQLWLVWAECFDFNVSHNLYKELITYQGQHAPCYPPSWKRPLAGTHKILREGYRIGWFIACQTKIDGDFIPANAIRSVSTIGENFYIIHVPKILENANIYKAKLGNFALTRGIMYDRFIDHEY